MNQLSFYNFCINPTQDIQTKFTKPMEDRPLHNSKPIASNRPKMMLKFVLFLSPNGTNNSLPLTT